MGLEVLVAKIIDVGGCRGERLVRQRSDGGLCSNKVARVSATDALMLLSQLIRSGQSSFARSSLHEDVNLPGVCSTA